MLDILKSIKVNILGSAALCIILGIVLVVYPNTSMTIVCRAVGVIVLITGLGMVVSYLRSETKGFFAKLGLIFGSILVVVGGFLVLRPLGLIAIIPIIFGILFIYHGLANMRQALELRQYEDRGWWVPVLIAATTILLGVFIINNPFETIDVVMRIIGACLIYDGLMNTMLVGRFVKSIRNFRKIEKEEAAYAENVILDEAEVIEGEYKEL